MAADAAPVRGSRQGMASTSSSRASPRPSSSQVVAEQHKSKVSAKIVMQTTSMGSNLSPAHNDKSDRPVESLRSPAHVASHSPCASQATHHTRNTNNNRHVEGHSPAVPPVVGETSSGEKRNEVISPFDVFGIFLACLLPTAAAVVGFSLPFLGVAVFNAVAPRAVGNVGMALLVALMCWLATLYIFDAHRAAFCVRALLLVATYLLGMLVALLKSTSYPWAVVLLTLCLGPAMLFMIRHARWRVKRFHFYIFIAAFTFLIAIAITNYWLAYLQTSSYTETSGARWSSELKERLIEDTAVIYENIHAAHPLIYDRDCGENNTEVEDTADRSAIKFACTRVDRIHVVIWSAPAVALIFNIFICIFCILQSRLDLDDEKDVARLLTHFAGLTAFLVMVVGASMTYVVGTSPLMAQAFFVFCVVAFLGLVVFVKFEVRTIVLFRYSERSMLAKYAVKAYHSDLMKAMAIIFWGPAVPCFLLLDGMRQRMRHVKGTTSSSGFLTEQGARVWRELGGWNWNGILSKVCFLGILFVVLLLGGKFTFILFSWLNSALASLHIAVVMTLVFFVGILMFMLPPVPGSAVYVFAGIVIGKKAMDSLGIWAAGFLASFIALLGKLLGSCGQYLIGYLLGKNVKVQKIIGVDTVPTRAIEKILKTPGLGLGKVAILVGGPDWPTSVTCGILSMNILQMTMGTLPVYPVSVLPQTFVGSLLVLDPATSGDPEFWAQISSACTSFAAVMQAVASLVAAYKIAVTIEKDGEELSKHRPEHDEVAELTRKEAKLVEAMQDVSRWDSRHMTCRRKATIIVAAGLMLLCGMIFVADFALSEPICFREFAITSDINASFQDGGLEGNLMNIVIPPVGHGNLGLFVFAWALFQFHSWDLGRVARSIAVRDKE